MKTSLPWSPTSSGAAGPQNAGGEEIGHHPVRLHEVPAAPGERAAHRPQGAQEIERRDRRRRTGHTLVGVQRAAVAEELPAFGGVTEGVHLDARLAPRRGNPVGVRRQHAHAVAAAHQGARQVADERARRCRAPAADRSG